MSRVREVRKVVRYLNAAAEDADAALLPYAGAIRVAARKLTAMAAELDLAAVDVEDSDGACQGCGQPLIQPDTGRRRQWCSEACRSRRRRQ